MKIELFKLVDSKIQVQKLIQSVNEQLHDEETHLKKELTEIKSLCNSVNIDFKSSQETNNVLRLLHRTFSNFISFLVSLGIVIFIFFVLETIGIIDKY